MKDAAAAGIHQISILRLAFNKILVLKDNRVLVLGASNQRISLELAPSTPKCVHATAQTAIVERTNSLDLKEFILN